MNTATSELSERTPSASDRCWSSDLIHTSGVRPGHWVEVRLQLEPWLPAEPLALFLCPHCAQVWNESVLGGRGTLATVSSPYTLLQQIKALADEL